MLYAIESTDGWLVYPVDQLILRTGNHLTGGVQAFQVRLRPGADEIGNILAAYSLESPSDFDALREDALQFAGSASRSLVGNGRTGLIGQNHAACVEHAKRINAEARKLAGDGT